MSKHVMLKVCMLILVVGLCLASQKSASAHPPYVYTQDQYCSDHYTPANCGVAYCDRQTKADGTCQAFSRELFIYQTRDCATSKGDAVQYCCQDTVQCSARRKHPSVSCTGAAADVCANFPYNTLDIQYAMTCVGTAPSVNDPCQ